MPGIVGLISKRPLPWAKSQLQRMLAAMSHESSRVGGTWVDERSGVYAGWTVRRNSPEDGMPFYDKPNDRVLIFCGEEYPEPQTAARLRRKGHPVDGKGAGYLLHLLDEDATFPKELNGRFHGLVVNRAAGTAMLFNDRYGMHRVYYHQTQDTVYFAAEAKAILAAVPELRNIDPRGLGEFVACGCVLEDRTLFGGVQVLPTASSWVFQDGALHQKRKYFEPSEWEEQGPLDPDSYYRLLREVFSTNLPRYLGGDEQVGMSLTGGLDTRMIMAWLKPPPRSLPSYTFGGPFRECQDVTIAREVAKVCEQPHQVIRVDDEFLSRFGDYAERAVYLSDGCVSVNRAADLYVNELAAKIAPVRLTGNYGSEILRRLRAFKPVGLPTGVFQPEVLSSADRARQTYHNLSQGHAVTFAAFRQAPWYQYGLLSLEQSQLSIRSPFLDNDLVRTAFRAPKSEIVKNDIFEDNDDCARLIADGNPKLHRIPTDRGLGGVGGWKAPISRGLLEFTFKAEYAYDYGMPQWLARMDHAVSTLRLERMFLGRHKFCHYRVWYRDQLSRYVRDVLLDPRSLSRPYIQSRAVESMVSRHLKGEANYTTEITTLLTLELQQRLFVDAAQNLDFSSASAPQSLSLSSCPL
jgi:asparagine synthase (glutamine-hydrolysing)